MTGRPYPRTVANQIMWIGPLPFSRARTRAASTSNPALAIGMEYRRSHFASDLKIATT